MISDVTHCSSRTDSSSVSTDVHHSSATTGRLLKLGYWYVRNQFMEV